MKILAVMGSPRKNKNTDQALEAFIKGALDNNNQVEKIYLKDLEYSNCIGCDSCQRQGTCVFKDDIDRLYEKLEGSDLLVLASPVYFNSVNSITKSFIDRAQMYWGIKYGYGRDKKIISEKQAIFIGVAGADFSLYQFSGTTQVVDLFMRAINAELKGLYYISQTDKRQVKDRDYIVNDLYSIGKNFESLEKFIIQKN